LDRAPSSRHHRDNPTVPPEESLMSQKTVFHLSAGVCFVIAWVLYVSGFVAASGSWLAALLITGGAFEALALLKLIEGPRSLSEELS
jgi:hypothetical protein